LPVPVKVNNTVTDPVRVRNVNDAIQPFQAAATCSATGGTTGACSANIFTVPTGKRAVIEYFSGTGLINTAPLGQVFSVSLTTEISGVMQQNAVPNITINGTAGGGKGAWGQQVRLYADPGPIIVANADDNELQSSIVGFGINGYLVDVPFTP
jgi:hypothetical protein